MAFSVLKKEFYVVYLVTYNLDVLLKGYHWLFTNGVENIGQSGQCILITFLTVRNDIEPDLLAYPGENCLRNFEKLHWTFLLVKWFSSGWSKQYFSCFDQ